MGVLPSVMLSVDGRECRAMVDSGCTRTLIHEDWCTTWQRQDVGTLTISEEMWRCLGVAHVRIVTACGAVAEVKAFVLSRKPFGFPCILGLDATDQMGGVTIRDDRTVKFGEQSKGSCGGVVAVGRDAVVSSVGEMVAAGCDAVVSSGGEMVAVGRDAAVSSCGEMVAAGRDAAVSSGGEVVAAGRDAVVNSCNKMVAVGCDSAVNRGSDVVAAGRGAAMCSKGRKTTSRRNTANQPASPVASQPGSPPARQPASPVARQPGSPPTQHPTGRGSCCPGHNGGAQLDVEERDFGARFNPTTKEWTVEWKWREDQEPGLLKNKMEQYAVPTAVQEPYELEVREWIRQGWLMVYDEAKLGPPKGLIPMMAVIQDAKDKVRPVMDFRELNQYIDAHTREADVCAHKTREWRRCGVKVAMVDLRKAYLQLRVKQELWPYQTVKIDGQQYCLTRLGFGLNVAPLVMKAVLNKVLEQDEEVRAGTSAYVDDILVNEEVVSAERVMSHLSAYGLETKQPERAAGGMRVLGMHVWQDGDVLKWTRDNDVTSKETNKMTRREVYSLCGKLIGHYPVCGWLRAAIGYLKRRASLSTSRWDDTVTDNEVVTYLMEVMARLKTDDPVRGRWDVIGESATVWVDASMLAYGAVLEVNGEAIEDASWLRKECTSHINMAELDAVLKGLNLALVWKMTTVNVMTDSATVHRWIEDGLTGKSRLRTRAANEMLIRRRVDVVMELVKEYGLNMTVTLVPSARNKADVMTRVPKKWMKEENEQDVVAMSVEDVAEIHRAVGHPGVRRTWYFAKQKDPQTTRRSAQQVVSECKECQSIDPASVKWRKGSLEVTRVWQRVAIDITHLGARRFLTLIDCGPSRFAVWRELQSQTSKAVINELRQVFYDRGAPEEILTDNDTAFKSARFMQFAADWAVQVRFRAAHAPAGNGIIERCHRTVKTLAARKGCSVMEAVYLYNVTPKDSKTPETAPMNSWGGYITRVRGIDEQVPQEDAVCRYDVGDAVWARPPSSSCNQQYDEGRVTRVVSEYTVEVNGIPRHVKDLRRRKTGGRRRGERKRCG